MSKIIKASKQMVVPSSISTNPTSVEKTPDIESTILQATKLIDQAKKEAESIVQNAKFKADSIVEEARISMEKERADLRTKAKEDGWQQGYSEGIEQGKQEVCEQTSESLKTLEAIISNATETRSRSLELLEDDFLKLSLFLAEKIVKKQIELDPSWLEPVIKEALHRLADVEHIFIRLNANDFQSLVALDSMASISAGKIQWESDESLEPGSCLISTDFGMIDASLDKRFAKLTTGLQEVIYSEE